MQDAKPENSILCRKRQLVPKMNYQKYWNGKMISAFRSLIGKFLEMELYCANSVVNSFCLVLSLAKSPFKEFLKVKGGVLLEVFTEFSNCEVQQTRFEMTGEWYCSFHIVEMLLNGVFT